MTTKRALESSPATITPLDTLFESKFGKRLPLPPILARLYGSLYMPRPQSHPYVLSNFVATLDGVVSLGVKGHASGPDISGHNAQDRMLMGLLRAIADVVIIGSGTLKTDSRHVWTAEAIFPDLSDEYLQLSKAMGKSSVPLNVIVTVSGDIDLRLPVFTSGKVQALIITTNAGEKHLREQSVPASVDISAISHNTNLISAKSILDEVCRVTPGKLILVEGGPQLLGHFFDERLVDEQFLTLAPQIAGRDADDKQISLVMGKAFALHDSLWGKLIDVRRSSSHLFLRYAFPET